MLALVWIPGVNLDNIAVFHCSAQLGLYIYICVCMYVYIYIYIYIVDEQIWYEVPLSRRSTQQTLN